MMKLDVEVTVLSGPCFFREKLETSVRKEVGLVGGCFLALSYWGMWGTRSEGQFSISLVAQESQNRAK